MKDSIVELISRRRIVVIARRIPADKIIPTAEALFEGGIRIIEVTFDQADPDCIKTTTRMISAIAEKFGDRMSVGAGTVLNREQVRAAVDTGAKFVLAPNVDADVVDEAVKLGAAAIPGAFTPTEVNFAYSLGAAIVKLFPAGDLGVGYVKSLRGPLNHIPLLAVGGINENNLMSYLNAGMVGAGIGSSIVKNSLIEQNSFEDIIALARKYTVQIQEKE